MKDADQIAVREFRLQPSEFWSMAPRHFWWLMETLGPRRRGSGLSEDDKREILGWLRGNDREGF